MIQFIIVFVVLCLVAGFLWGLFRALLRAIFRLGPKEPKYPLIIPAASDEPMKPRKGIDY